MAAEIGATSRYYARIIQWMRADNDPGCLLDSIDCPARLQVGEKEPFPPADPRGPTLVLLNGTLNHSLDIQKLLTDLRPGLSRSDRVIAVVYNPYMRWLYRLATGLGFRKGPIPSTFVTRTELRHLAAISGYEVVRLRPSVYLPLPFMGIGTPIKE